MRPDKTLRYPGHARIFKAYKDLGLFREEKIVIDGKVATPRQVLFQLLEPVLYDPEARDVGIIYIKARGRKAEVMVKLVDYYDAKAGFRAMERLTGFHTAIVLELAVKGEIEKGVIPIERALSGHRLLELTELRNWKIDWKVSQDNR